MKFDYDSYVCEYSPRSGNFHVHTLGEAIDKNRAAVMRGCTPDYIPLGLYETADDALDACERFRKTISYHRGEEAS